MGVELTVAMSLTVVPWASLLLRRRRRRLLLVPVVQFCRGTSVKTLRPVQVVNTATCVCVTWLMLVQKSLTHSLVAQCT